jgi:hypothetical protein
MSETEFPPDPMPAIVAPAPPLPAAPPAKPEKPRKSFWPVLGIIGFLILAAGEVYLWRLHQMIPDDAAQIAALQSQIAALRTADAHAAPAPDSITVQADLAEKFAALNAQVGAMQTQLAADHGTLTQLSANSTDVTKLTAKIALLSTLEDARMALEAGQPLGDIPNAPPALAKFAETAPPTQAALLLAYPDAARAADNASVARVQKGKFWAGVVSRLENMITISDGAHVLVGAPAAAITAQAGALLDAGDLNGAVNTLNGLSPETQSAMGTWLQQARDLLAARAAIISMAGQG